ncbi:hypothetical protein [Streptomyces sp. NPDC015131]|uniref:hypothetical protein n=1 Tax=Streptomyces sp. NPDC015131 TaxID=3364941 RepID=UPI0036FCFB3E
MTGRRRAGVTPLELAGAAVALATLTLVAARGRRTPPRRRAGAGRRPMPLLLIPGA